MIPTADPLRGALLAAAEGQLIASPDSDVSTRGVCEAAGVTQPVLYRIFGDKRGLLDALADLGLERYAARKGELEVSDDPLADLSAGWDDHMAFATDNPALYQLMFSPRPWASTRPREGIRELLELTLARCAAIGALRTTVTEAAAMLLSANIGLALNRIAEPEVFGSTALSDSLRRSVFAAILTEADPSAALDPLAAAALRLKAQLRVTNADNLSPEEAALLGTWLDRIS